MRTSELVELCAIAIAVFATPWLASFLPAKLTVGGLVLVVASIVLAQGLLRDLWLIWRQRSAFPSGPRGSQSCLCVESGLGVVSIALGLVLLLAGVTAGFKLGRTNWTFLVAASLLAGFFLKDWVFSWRPWRLRREKDHANVLIAWRWK